MSSPPANPSFLSLRSQLPGSDLDNNLFLAPVTGGSAPQVGLAAKLGFTSCKQPTLEANSKRGTIDPDVVVRRSWFETTALEMPAGFGRNHHRATLARDGWPDPHLRTGDVTLVSTTDETCSNVKLLQREQGVVVRSLSLRSETAQRHRQ